jgi:hypothetical protein
LTVTSSFVCNFFQSWPQPDSLAEITFDAYMGLDFYDISLVDGFGVPLKMTPLDGTFEQNHADGRSCKSIACQADLIAGCPEELKLRQGDRVVACQSACTKFHSEEYCCTGRSVLMGVVLVAWFLLIWAITS